MADVTSLAGAVMAIRRKPTFADIVRSAIDNPKAPDTRRLPPGRHNDVLVTANQRRWSLVVDNISHAEAQSLLGEGAALAFDPCGCGGACGLDLLPADVTAGLIDAKPPTTSSDPRYPGTMSHWTAADDPTTSLILASGRVVWGRALT
jgi:hypothetical protein